MKEIHEIYVSDSANTIKFILSIEFENESVNVVLTEYWGVPLSLIPAKTSVFLNYYIYPSSIEEIENGLEKPTYLSPLDRLSSFCLYKVGVQYIRAFLSKCKCMSWRPTDLLPEDSFA